MNRREIVIILILLVGLPLLMLNDQSGQNLESKTTFSQFDTMAQKFLAKRIKKSELEKRPLSEEEWEKEIKTSFTEEVKSCFPKFYQGLEAGFDTWGASEFIHNISSYLGHALEDPLVRFENYKLELPDGSTRVLYLESELYRAEKFRKKLQVFSYDREGLPKVEVTVREESTSSTERMIEQYLRTGKVINHTFSQEREFERGVLSYVEKNGEILEVEVNSSEKDFSCEYETQTQQLECFCG